MTRLATQQRWGKATACSTLLLWVGLGGTWLSACAGPNAQIVREVSRDWKCAESQIEVERQGQDVYRASGCGQTALYQCDKTSRPGTPADPHSSMGQEEDYRVQESGACYRLKRPED